MKKRFFVVMTVLSITSLAFAGDATLDDVLSAVHSNGAVLKKLDKKADTAQVSLDRIEGTAKVLLAQQNNVFRLEVKKGGSTWLAANKYAEEIGISQREAMIVILGMNNISKPDNIKAGRELSAPKPGTKEYRNALKRGAPLYEEWLKSQEVHVKVASVKMKRLDVTEEAHFASVVKDKEIIHDLIVDKEVHKDATYKKLVIDDLTVKKMTLPVEVTPRKKKEKVCYDSKGVKTNCYNPWKR